VTRDAASGRLLYRYETPGPDGAETARIAPSPVQWDRFWSAVERLGVWEWEAEYSRRPPPDSMTWELELAHDGRRVRSRGHGEGPTTLPDLIVALSELLGGRDL
jgi:hypothetical protein